MAVPAWIDEFARSSYQLFYHHDPKSHQVFNVFGLYDYYDRLWIDRLYETILKWNGSGASIAEIAKHMPNPSSCRFIFVLISMHLKNSNITDKEKIKTICDFFYNVIRFKTAGKDVFAHDSNQMHARKEIGLLAEKTPWTKSDENWARELGKLSVGCATLVHTMYSDWMTDYSYEIYGPYDVSKHFGKNAILLVRDFEDLKPDAYWPGASKFKHKSIRLLTVYKNLACKIAYVGCHATYSGSIISHLAKHALYADGKLVPRFEGLKNISSYYLKTAQSTFADYQKLAFEEKKRIYFHQEAYPLKSFFEGVGVNWKPPKEFFAAVKGKPLLESPWPNYNLTLREYSKKFGMDKIKQAYE